MEYEIGLYIRKCGYLAKVIDRTEEQPEEQVTRPI